MAESGHDEARGDHTHHGRARLILTSADEFDRRETLGQPGGGDNQLARTTAQLRGILAQIQEGFVAFDKDLRLSDVNRVGELYFGFAKEDLVEKSLQDILPATQNAIYWNYFKRVLKTGEILDFRCRSAIYPNATVAIRAFPYEGGVGAVFENITVKEEASLDQRSWKALQNAVKADPAMALIKLNVRGGIISADENFSAITGFPEEQAPDLPLGRYRSPSRPPIVGAHHKRSHAGSVRQDRRR